MNGLFYIDGIDAYSAYGMTVLAGSYKGLIAYPPLKEVPHIDWHEHDGIDVDLSNPVLNKKELTIRFSSTGYYSSPGEFISILSGSPYHDFYFKEIERTVRLRLVQNGKLKLYHDGGDFELTFADDFALKDYTYSAPESSIPSHDDYEIDGKRLSDYGVYVIAGTLNEIEKSPAVKRNMLRNINTVSGSIYGGKSVTYQPKDVDIKCIMRAPSLTALWRNYDALLFDLVRPGERNLYVEATGMEYPCYYKKGAVSRLYMHSEICLDFSFTMVFTSFRACGDSYLLATECEELVVTENNEYFIDTKYYGD